MSAPIHNRLSNVIVSLPVSSGKSLFWSGQTKDYNIDSYYFFTKHAAFLS